MDKNKGRRVREVVFTAAGFVILMAIIWYISGSVKKTPLLSEDGMEYVKGTVTEIIKGNKGNGSSSAAGMAGSQDVKVKITSGSYKGKIVEANNLNGYLYGANCQVGTRVILQVSAYEGNLTANVYNYDREYGLYALIGLFLIGAVPHWRPAGDLLSHRIDIYIYMYHRPVPATSLQRGQSFSGNGADGVPDHHCIPAFDRRIYKKNGMCGSRNHYGSSRIRMYRHGIRKDHTYFRLQHRGH